MSSSRTGVCLATCATRAIVAFGADGTLVLLLLTAGVANSASLAISQTLAVELIIVGASGTGNNWLTSLTVATLGAWDESPISGTLLAIVAWWAVTASSCICGTFHVAKGAGWALGLDATSAVRATRATIVPVIS